MKRKTIILAAAVSLAVVLASCSTAVRPADEPQTVKAAIPEKPGKTSTVLLDNPEDMNVTLQGKPEANWYTHVSETVPVKPNTWYRASVEIKTALKPGPGKLRFRVVQKNGEQNLVNNTLATLSPAILDFAPYSGVFLTRSDCRSLQVFYHLSKLDGTASFRNLKLEEISEEEAEKIRSAYQVPPAFFTPPVYAYAGERELPWGYRITAELMAKNQIPAKITIRLPELSVEADEAAKVNTFATSRIKLDSPLKKGKYTVLMTALDAAGKVLAREERVLRVIDRPKPPVRLPVKSVEIDSAGNTIINGKPVLLNGLFHVYTEPQVREVAEAGFNTVIAWEPTPEKYLSMLNWISKYDLYSDCVIKRLKPEELADLLKVIGKHPSIVSFDPEDEPDIKDITPEMILPRINQIRAACPGIPMRISCASPNVAGKYGVCSEIICAHHYVIPFGGLPLQVKSTETVVSTFPEPRKHSPQMTLQSWLHWHDITCRPQTPEQTKSLAYIALICGAKGLWWYSFIDVGTWDVRSVPSVWTAFKGLNAELADLEEVILTGKRLPVKIEAPNAGEEPPVIAAVWQLPGRTVLAAVNTLKAPVSARIAGLPGEKITELFADDAAYEVKSGAVDFPLPPETTRVFEIQIPPAN